MNAIKTTTKNVKYLGRKCKLTTIYYTKSNEGKRLIIREFEDGANNDIKLIEGFYGKYEKKIPFKTFDKVETQTAYQKHLQNQGG
jgi:hypothetical protein